MKKIIPILLITFTLFSCNQAETVKLTNNMEIEPSSISTSKIDIPVYDGWEKREFTSGEPGYQYVSKEKTNYFIVTEAKKLPVSDATYKGSYWIKIDGRFFEIMKDQDSVEAEGPLRISTALSDKKIVSFLGRGGKFREWVKGIKMPTESPLANSIIEDGMDKAHEVNLYYINNEKVAEGTSPFKEWLEPVEIYLSDRENVPYETLKLLISHPWIGERNDISNAIPEGVQILELSINNKVAYANFSEELEKGGGSTANMSKAAQIEMTLMQFPEVEKVVIAVNGRTEDILQP